MRKKRNLILGLICMIVIIGIPTFVHYTKKDVWEINATNLIKAFQPISGDADIEDLRPWIPFEWDTLYSFSPYTTKETIYQTIGYKWSDISETVNEGMNQIVFVDDSKVVCYLFGYPEHSRIGFNLGEYEGSYIKLTTEQKLPFNITENNGVRYFELIK
ncbi:hypothetical protein PB01_16860 [Psychrobacillus glaciei]|uniref:Uncharacterized protein n=1 Tax=Psychrobacillus glaciei TaxID=2283160 RepID=A0A5J6SQV2_9BACI|nr:hypothetical protein [Psychrobacillus glaciei]QFG00346.1 hypothetical protein PB01_16860 [Psychrobacillus glaciei]